MFHKGIRFRYRVLLTILLVFIPFILIGSTIAYYQIKGILQTNIERELQRSTDSLVNLIKTAASVSIENRLHAIAEKNLDLAQYYYNKYRSGLLTESEAIKQIEEIFLNQSVGVSGYIYCLNSKGDVIVHPNDQVKGTNVSKFDFARQQMVVKDGYLEYEWKNPEDSQKRQKALYMVYFKALDWIISVSTYREEFNYLVDIDDFRESILSYQSGETGYAFIMDEDGTALVHPTIQGINFLTEYADLNKPLLKLFETDSGEIKYLWKSSDESRSSEKIVIFKHLPEYQWVVASSSYVDEVFAPLGEFRNLLFAGILSLLIASLALAYFISRVVTKPLEAVMEKLEGGAEPDFSVRMHEGGAVEFVRLSDHFNSFMRQLEQNHKKIEAEIKKTGEVQAALIENDLKLRGLFNQSFQFTGILSTKGLLEEVNQSSLDFIGCEATDVIHRLLWETPWWNHDIDARNKLKDAVCKASRGKLVRFETTNISKKAEIRNFDVSIKPVFNSSDEVAFLIAEGRDITKYKKAARERKELAVKLEKSQKMEAIGTLAGGIAHDFNNILSGILGYAQLALMSLDNPGKTEVQLEQIVKGAERAASLTRQILAFSRQKDYEKQPLALYNVVEEALNLLRSSIPTTIEIREKITSKSMVFADSTQMHQVIMNLCTNASHAMEKRGGLLSVQLNEVEIVTDTDFFDRAIIKGRYLELEVADSGSGMDSKTLIKAFDPYFTTKELGKGTGFGLSLVHAIVDAHEGYLKAVSRPGEGACFSIYLPVVSGEIVTSEKKSPAGLLKGGTETIMVVDDEEDIRMFTEEFLRKFGYDVCTFESGFKALEVFKKNPNRFDLVITDMTMPKMEGDEFSRKILQVRQDIPIILCTGYSITASETAALEIGVLKFLEKPVSGHDLCLSIRQVLDR